MHLPPLIERYLVRFNLKIHNDSELVGLDIGRDFIKLLKINKAESPHLVENFSYMSTPAAFGGASKDPAKDNIAIANAINNMFITAGVTTKQVALAIPRSIAILKSITIDNRLTADEIETRAWIEANRHFPDLIGEIFLDFFVSAPLVEDPNRLELTLVACRKEQIKPYLDILRLAGLQAKLVDVDCYALERALPYTIPKTPDDTTVALLNLNTEMSTLIVTQANHLIYANDQGYDGQRLISQTNGYLKDNNKTRSCEGNDLLNDNVYHEILKNNLISHLRHTMHFFSTSRPNINIKKLIIAGDCASVPCLVPFINNEIGIETIIADLLAHLILSPTINATEFKQHAPGLALCCGLALSQVEY